MTYSDQMCKWASKELKIYSSAQHLKQYLA